MQQVLLTIIADQYLTMLMEQGYTDPAHIVEQALAEMVKTELGEPELETPERLEWLRREVAIGAEQLDRGQFSTRSPKQIRAEVLADYQRRQANP